MEAKNKRRWAWMLATGAAVAGGAYLLYNAWSLVCARVCVRARGFVWGGWGGRGGSKDKKHQNCMLPGTMVIYV
jgi:hypothetical protein